MLVPNVFALLENTADAAYTVTADGEVRSWNSAAVRLFGYPAREAIGRNVEELFDARDTLGTAALAGRRDTAARRWTASMIPAFDLEVRTRSGARIWVNLSTIVLPVPRTREALFIRLARDVGDRRRREALTAELIGRAREIVSLADAGANHAPVTSLSSRERRVLQLFAEGRNSSSVARRLGISGQTVRNHLHRINRKLRTHSRLEAVTHAINRGLLD